MTPSANYPCYATDIDRFSLYLSSNPWLYSGNAFKLLSFNVNHGCKQKATKQSRKNSYLGKYHSDTVGKEISYFKFKNTFLQLVITKKWLKNNKKAKSKQEVIYCMFKVFQIISTKNKIKCMLQLQVYINTYCSELFLWYEFN